MAYSQYSELQEVKLVCSCGQVYAGRKINSHNWIARHKPCVVQSGVKLVLSFPKVAKPERRDPMERDTDQGFQEIEWSDARAIRAQMAGAK